MKIQLDTTEKTIKVEEKVNLGELVKVLDKLLPNKEWKQYELETNTTINWGGQTIIYKDYYPYKSWPWYGQTYCGTSLLTGTSVPTLTTSNSSNTVISNKTTKGGIYTNGVYNIEVEA